MLVLVDKADEQHSNEVIKNELEWDPLRCYYGSR